MNSKKISHKYQMNNPICAFLSLFIFLTYTNLAKAQQPQPIPAQQPKMTIKDAKTKCKKEGKTEEQLIDCIKQNTHDAK